MDSEEFKNTWLQYSGRFYRTAFFLLESAEDATDAVQDLYLKLWDNRDYLHDVKNPQAYGTTILRNLCMDRIRHSHVSETQDIDSVPEGRIPAQAETPERKMMTKETLGKLESLIEKLPDRQRNVLKLNAYDHLGYDEISERTGLSGIYVRVLISTARKSLRKQMKEI